MLQIAILDAPDGVLLFDLSGLAHNVTATTNGHGFATLTANMDLPLSGAFGLYDRPGLPHVVLADGAEIVFEGRLEDVAITDLGARLTAFGYWRALSDVIYTALWSDTRVSEWRAIRKEDVLYRAPDLYQMDTNNRLYITPAKGNTFRNGIDMGSLVYEAPSQGQRDIARVSFTYELLAPANWRARLTRYDNGFTGGAVEWYLDATGSAQTGTVTQNLASPAEIVVFDLLNNTGSGVTLTAETGEYYLKITNVRVMSTTASTVTVDAIAAALATYVHGANSSQLSAASTLIAAPGLDLTDEVYQDAYPADILTRLAGLGDNQTPPRQWEVGVWESRLLHLRQRGSAGRAWYVDAGSLDMERSLATLSNAVYGVYQDADNRVRRTEISVDTGSIVRFALTRQAAVAAQTTSSTQAGVQRDAYLADHATPPTRSGIMIAALYDAGGGRWPLWAARSGDTITIRNLPPTLSLDVDRIRTFRIAETSYSCDTDVLSVTPELPRPSLEVLVARNAAGLERQ